MAMSICAREEGLGDAFSKTAETSMRHQYGDKVVHNVVTDKNFRDRVDSHIKQSGGCNVLMAEMRKHARDLDLKKY